MAQIAQEAGALVLRHFKNGTPVRRKSDFSPVTAADEEAEQLILARLAEIAPDVPVIAEECMSRGGQAEAGRRFFLVDPLDGTEEFVAKRDEFTVNIALVEDGMAVCGALVAPAKDRAFLGEKGKGAWEIARDGSRRSIAARSPPDEGLTVLVSRSHAQAGELGPGIRLARTVSMGSSLKLAIIAAGEADFYPRMGRTMEWDIAAGQALLEAAGGSVRTVDGQPLRYGKPGLCNGGFIARGRD